ncbi:MAG: hypothetical protein AMS17_18040 [Spirochaetes bacterium DG_61]|nr:MAG: hypothetical protein AMS17_18040 [Spirochaetes bacterium DG_61]
MRINGDHHSVIPLLMLTEGETARVAWIDGGHGIRRRLADIGIIPGKKIGIAHGAGKGPRIVVIDETKVMVGRGMLHKIFVKL